MSKMNNVTFATSALRLVSGPIKYTMVLDVRTLTGTQMLMDGRVRGNTWDQSDDRSYIFLDGSTIRTRHAGGTVTIKVDNVETSTLTTGRHTVEISFSGANPQTFVNMIMSNAIADKAAQCLKGVSMESIRGEFASLPENNFHYNFNIINDSQPEAGMYLLPNLIEGITDRDGAATVAGGGWTSNSGTWTQTGSGRLFLAGNSTSMDSGLVRIKLSITGVTDHRIYYIDVNNSMASIDLVNGDNEVYLITGRNHGTDKIHVFGNANGSTISNIEFKYVRTKCFLRVANQNNWVEKTTP